MSQPLMTYYDVFLQWVDDRYSLEIEGRHYSKLIYDPRLKQWFFYRHGYYNPIEIQKIRGIYLRCMKEKAIPQSSTQMHHCIQQLETVVLFTGKWDDGNPAIDCVKNGVVNLLDKTLMPHSPQYHFKYQIERNFIEGVDPVIPERFNKCLNAIPDKKDRDNYLKFWLAVVHKIHDYEVFLLCFGVKWGGKSSNLSIFSEMYGSQVVGKKPLNQIAKRFGMSNIYDKRLNIHPDMPIVDIDPYTISLLKSLTGNDGDIDIEIKGVTPFIHPVELFLAFGINQLQQFNHNAEKEIDSIMRRVVLVEFPTVQHIDSEFKKSLSDPNFLDTLYSWFVITSSLPLFYPEEQEEWIKNNKKKWLMNSDPILRILMDNYRIEPSEEVDATSVVLLVREELEQDGIFIPKNLKAQITQAFSSIAIFTNNRRGSSCKYVGVEAVEGTNKMSVSEQQEAQKTMDELLELEVMK